MKLVFDTNILLDYCFSDRDTKNLSTQLFTLAIENNHECLVPANSVNDFFYIVCNLIKRQVEETDTDTQRQIAWGLFDNIKNFVTFIGCDQSDIFIAEKLRDENSDLEDNMIIAASMRADADYLVSNDKLLLKKQLVPTATPKQIIETISQ